LTPREPAELPSTGGNILPDSVLQHQTGRTAPAVRVPPGRARSDARRTRHMKTFALTTSTAILLAGAATAQMFGPDYGTDLDTTRFSEGLAGTGIYEIIDINEDQYIDRDEYGYGLYADYDLDGDSEITDTEFERGYTRYRGDSEVYDANMFSQYDADESGYLDYTEFDGYYGDNEDFYFSGADMDMDERLDFNEYGTGLYNAADYDENQVLTIEEEGFFEGWFDGDDLEAEIQSLDEVYSDL
jgi:hypothetical protein